MWQHGTKALSRPPVPPQVMSRWHDHKVELLEHEAVPIPNAGATVRGLAWYTT